jgi:hypothetical protein
MTPTVTAPPAATSLSLAGVDAERFLTSEAIVQALGQSVREALRLEGWDQGAGLEQLLDQVPSAIGRSVAKEQELRGHVRRLVLAELRHFPDAPPGAGVYRVRERHLRDARRHVLLSGVLTAADGAGTGHDGLAATLVSLGVALVRYDGALRSWRTTFLRHDFDAEAADPLAEVRSVLDRRAGRSPEGPGNGHRPGGDRDRLTYLLRRAFMAAAERKALLERGTTRWRMGHGVPAPLELLTGSGCMELIDEMLPVLEQLLLQETRWVFLPEGLANRALLTVANALEPNELALLQKGKPTLEDMVERGTYDLARKRRVQAFATRAGEAFVVGGFRATPQAPAQLFFAHAEHALEAGTIALADAALQPHRGFPLLLELAGLAARTGLGIETFGGGVEAAYARLRARGLFTPERLLTSIP